MVKKKKESKWLIGILIILFIVIFFLINSKFFNKQEKCEKENGFLVNTNQKYYCNYQTSDFGKFCSDINQCEGTCLADIDEKIGKCSEFKFIYGCQKELINGNVEFICHD